MTEQTRCRHCNKLVGVECQTETEKLDCPLFASAVYEEQQSYDDYAAGVDKARAEWAAKWPNHCTKCEGWGGFSYTQKHDEGPGEPMFDLCGALEATQCHRCGQHGLTSDDPAEVGLGPCKFCGWNFDDGMPQY